MVDINSKTEQVRVNISSVGNKGNVSFAPIQNYYDGLAKQWAVSDKLVNGEDYSSKHYAEESKKQADLATEKATIATNKVDEVVESGNEALSKISVQETASKNAVKAEGDTQVARVQAEGETQFTNVQVEGQAQVDNVKNQGTTSVSLVNSTGTTQINAVKTEGVNQINLAKAEVVKATEQANLAKQYASSVDKESINISKMYTTGTVSTDTQGYTQLLQMKQSAGSGEITYDSSKFRLINNPTITSDGILSPSSGQNGVQGIGFKLGQLKNKSYIIRHKSTLSQETEYEMAPVCYSLSQSDPQYMFSNSFVIFGASIFVGAAFGTESPVIDGISHGVQAVTLTNLNSLNMSLGGEYVFEASYDGVSVYTYSIYQADNTLIKSWNYTPTTEDKNLYLINQYPDETFNIGYSGDVSNNDYEASTSTTDLKTFEIIIDGQTVFSSTKEDIPTQIDKVIINNEAVEIPYVLSKTGSKIVDVAYRDKVQALYAQTGTAPYYTIDETNKNFTLPMGEIYGMIEQKSSEKGNFPYIPGFLYKTTGWIDESKNIFRYPNGQVILENRICAGLTTFLDEQEKLGNTSIFCTETEWQAIKSASKFGQCGKYVRDKVAGTVRLPLIINEQGLNDLASCGVIKNESLPNITGHLGLNGQSTAAWWSDNGQSGTLYGEKRSVDYGQGKKELQAATIESGTTAQYNTIAFDASRSSSTYQNNAPVQQEAIQYPYVLCINSGVEEAERPINNYQVNNVYSYGVSQYYKGEMGNLSWLKSEGQENPKGTYSGVYEWILKQRQKGVKQLYGWRNSVGVSTYTDTPTPTVGSLVYGYNPMVNYGTISAYDGTTISTQHYPAYGGHTDTGTAGYQRATDLDATWYVYNDNGVNFLTKEELDNWTHPVNTSDYDFKIDTTNETFRLPLKNGQEGVFAKEVVTNSSKNATFTNQSMKWALKDGTDLSGVAATLYALGINGVGNGTGYGLVSGTSQALVTTQWDIVPSNMVVNTAVPDGWNLYYYVGETVQNANLIDAGRIGEGLANKVDLNLANLSSEGKETMTAYWIANNSPSINIPINLTITTTTQYWEAPSNGYVWFYMASASSGAVGFIGVQEEYPDLWSITNINRGWLYLNKGQHLSVRTDIGTITLGAPHFIAKR